MQGARVRRTARRPTSSWRCAVGAPSDFRRAAGMIMAANPLGGVCGAVCPETHCMAACARATFDTPVEIPAVQATIIAKARALGVMPEFTATWAGGPRVAIVGGGPAGAGAAAVLAQAGCRVDVLEAARRGRHGRADPAFRLGGRGAGRRPRVRGRARRGPRAGARGGGPGRRCSARATTRSWWRPGCRSRCVSASPARSWRGRGPRSSPRAATRRVAGRRVAVIGGGAVAADCAETAAAAGAAHVELFALEKLSEMPLTAKERAGLLQAGVHVSGRTRVAAVLADGRRRVRPADAQGRPPRRGGVPPQPGRGRHRQRADSRRHRHRDRRHRGAGGRAARGAPGRRLRRRRGQRPDHRGRGGRRRQERRPRGAGLDCRAQGAGLRARNGPAPVSRAHAVVADHRTHGPPAHASPRPRIKSFAILPGLPAPPGAAHGRLLRAGDRARRSCSRRRRRPTATSRCARRTRPGGPAG